jgi:hypothetical protein
MTPDAGIGTEAIRHALEGEVIRWPNVHSKKMFGSPAYLVEGRIFALLIHEGIVLTRLNERERREITARFPAAHPFVGHGQPIPSWVEVPIERPGDLSSLLPYLRKSYEQAVR